MGVPAATPLIPVPSGPERDTSTRRSFGHVVVVLGVVAVAIVVAAYVMPQAARPAKQPQVEPVLPPPTVAMASHTVAYELLGEGAAQNVTYAGEGASLVQLADVGTPWSTTFTRTGPADRSEFYSVSAQNAGDGSLRCRITVDGVVVADKTVTGEGTLFSCAA